MQSFFLFSCLLTLGLSQYVCVQNTEDSFYDFDGTYMYWNTTLNGANVYDQTTDEHNYLYKALYAQCAIWDSTWMDLYGATECWCIDGTLSSSDCEYYAPVNDSVSPGNVYWGWYEDLGDKANLTIVTDARCAGDIPDSSFATSYCSSGSPDSFDIDGTYTKTGQEYNGEAVWFHQEKTKVLGVTFLTDYWLFLGLNGTDSECEDIAVQSAHNSPYCWCIELLNPFSSVFCDYYAPIASKDIAPDEVTTLWYEYGFSTSTVWPDYGFVEGEGCNNQVGRLSNSFIVMFLCFFIGFILQ